MPEVPEYYDNFGQVLRGVREGIIPRRVRRNNENPDLPGNNAKVTSLSLIGCMKTLGGYSISSGAYSEIEQGISIPKDPRRFIRAVGRCAEIEHDELLRDLEQQAVFDQTARKFGIDVASRTVSRPVRRDPRIPHPIR